LTHSLGGKNGSELREVSLECTLERWIGRVGVLLLLLDNLGSLRRMQISAWWRRSALG
jgi:hypothetical protein